MRSFLKVIPALCTIIAACGGSGSDGGGLTPPPPPPPPPDLKISITSPTPGATISDTSRITYNVTGGTPPYTASVSIDGGTAVQATSPYSWVTYALHNTSHRAKITVTDASSPQKTVSDSITVTVSNLLTPDSSFVTVPASNAMVMFCAPPTFTRSPATDAQVGLGYTQSKTRTGGGKTAQYCSGAAKDSGFALMFVGKSITDVFSKQASDSLRLSAAATVNGSAVSPQDLTIYIQRFNGNPPTRASVVAAVTYNQLQASPTAGYLPDPLHNAPISGTTGYYNGMLFGLKWRCTTSGVSTTIASVFSLSYYYKDKTGIIEASDPFTFTVTCP